jgi:hypothetical protein
MSLSALGRRLGPCVLALVALGCGGKSLGSAPGICQDSCLKDCRADDDCDVSTGELCCEIPSVGSACMPASQCPRACNSDSTCDLTKGQACLPLSLDVDTKFCTAPSAGLRTCVDDGSCQAGETCCGIYSSPICLPPNQCPKICSLGPDCNGALGEICCTTAAALDPAISAPGLCLAPALCPRACTQSTDCNTGTGELCCNGICSTNCPKSCLKSADCSGQVCCKNPVSLSMPITQSGFPVATPGSGGAFGTGGTFGSGGTFGTGGAFGTGGFGGTGGSVGAGGTFGTGGSLGTGGAAGSGGMGGKGGNGGMNGSGGALGTGGAPQRCVGTPLYDCATCGSIYGCIVAECPGCATVSTGVGTCGGTRYYSCSDFFYDPYQCAATPGCYYYPGLYNGYYGYCFGTPVPCSYISDEATCHNQYDCTWSGTQTCAGTPMACSQLSTTQCWEPGCSVQ